MFARHVVTRGLTCLLLAACGQAPAGEPAETTPATLPAAATQAAPPRDSTDAERELAVKQAKLAYAEMEDRYLNDAAGQWAATARASSTYGDEDGRTPDPANGPTQATGAPDTDAWSNNHQDLGFDWLETGFARPAQASELRIVFPSGGAEAVTKLELQDTGGAWHTVWSGVSDVARDRRGTRTWFVRAFERTPYTVKAAKITFANNVERGYKEVDAVQLVGN